MGERYWMVLGAQRPTVRHSTEAKARAEAERLAKANSGMPFVVLEAKAEYRCKQPVDVTELSPVRGVRLLFRSHHPDYPWPI